MLPVWYFFMREKTRTFSWNLNKTINPTTFLNDVIRSDDEFKVPELLKITTTGKEIMLHWLNCNHVVL